MGPNPDVPRNAKQQRVLRNTDGLSCHRAEGSSEGDRGQVSIVTALVCTFRNWSALRPIWRLPIQRDLKLWHELQRNCLRWAPALGAHHDAEPEQFPSHWQPSGLRQGL